MDPSRAANHPGKNLGWTLAIALIIAVSIAISIAVQLDSPGRSEPRVTPPECGGLYQDDSSCCDDWDRPEPEHPGPEPRGLFDAEEDFAANC